MALAAEIPEDLLAGVRIADVRAEEFAHLGHDFFPFGISLVADFAERFFHRPECFAIVALQDFAEVVGVEHGFGKFFLQHRVEEFSRPRLALHDQINRQRLNFRVQASGIRPG